MKVVGIVVVRFPTLKGIFTGCNPAPARRQKRATKVSNPKRDFYGVQPIANIELSPNLLLFPTLKGIFTGCNAQQIINALEEGKFPTLKGIFTGCNMGAVICWTCVSKVSNPKRDFYGVQPRLSTSKIPSS